MLNFWPDNPMNLGRQTRETEDTMIQTDKRKFKRKKTHQLKIEELTCLDTYSVIATSGHIIDASTYGFLIELNRNELVESEHKSQLHLDAFLNKVVALYIPEMALDLDGRIVRSKHIGQGNFEIAIEFSEDIPEYWRGCLMDLLPEPGEVE